ncbi:MULTISPECIES: hypothetical protein [Klebsiella]|uniref:hypothetical protein n=1 Tax=Klebsiella TaxID=570 RepID=UPI0020B7158F|nr:MULTISPECIES: hypothetical protein [Klebsiella]
MSLLLYRSNKVVEAMEIVSVVINPDYSAVLSNSEGFNITVSSDFVVREKPRIGGYYMKNHDGFEAYIDKDVFETDFSEDQEV